MLLALTAIAGLYGVSQWMRDYPPYVYFSSFCLSNKEIEFFKMAPAYKGNHTNKIFEQESSRNDITVRIQSF